MAILNLTQVWINRLDTGEAVSAYSAPGRDRSQSKQGEVRTYAGGRQRAITKAGARGAFDFTLRRVTLAQVELLESWIGIPVQVRDHRGQRFFGVFFEVPAVEHQDDRNRYDVPLALRTITAAEGV
ncbi:hypothetical protein [Micromonospora sp. NPDC004551]|uniref:hypothetical protein n=1 Tax=Micromonospora sp. NPDC004551 TaxID=3154284 RepID=UPI0033ADB6F3